MASWRSGTRNLAILRPGLVVDPQTGRKKGAAYPEGSLQSKTSGCQHTSLCPLLCKEVLLRLA